jgi:hypothetical protein
MSGLLSGARKYSEPQTLAGTPNVIAVPTSAPADGVLAAAQFTVWVDESGNTLTFKVKYSGGTVKSGTVALT